jgi:hypothetical protein
MLRRVIRIAMRNNVPDTRFPGASKAQNIAVVDLRLDVRLQLDVVEESPLG